MLKRQKFSIAAATVFCCGLLTNVAPCSAAPESPVAVLPDAPAAQPDASSSSSDGSTGSDPSQGASFGDRILNELDPGYDHVAGKWDVTINAGQKVQPFSAGDKLHYAWTEEFDPVSLFTASWTAGYEHLRDAAPHFGSDKAGFGERLGASAMRQGLNRAFGDGVLAAATHEDPRYYRVAQGSIWHRAERSAMQSVVRHRDNGTWGISYSGLGGHAIAEGLPMTFYPSNSAGPGLFVQNFGTSLAAEAGLKLVREFLPDLFQASRLTRRK